jgi:uncharacterized protein YeeX (DUF496 family)
LRSYEKTWGGTLQSAQLSVSHGEIKASILDKQEDKNERILVGNSIIKEESISRETASISNPLIMQKNQCRRFP